MLRERFVIHDKSSKKNKEPVIAMGNRLVVKLKSVDGKLTEHMIIRGHNMHSVARTAARIYLDFDRKGPILSRVPEYDWDGLWDSVCSKYEQDNNPQNWVAIYFKGRKIFSHGENHKFLDIMEQCDASNRDEYDHAVTIAEDIFKQAGKEVKIEKDTNIAAVINVTDKQSRCGLILRGAQKSSTFSVTLEAKKDQPLARPSPHICLNLSAAYLEAIQLAFRSGQLAAKVAIYGLTRTSPESILLQSTNRRIGRLNAEIKSYEQRFSTRYRPESPDILSISEETRRMFNDVYAAQKRQEEYEAAIAAGEEIPMVE